MTKSDLIKKLTDRNNYLFQKDIHKVIHIIFNSISEALENGDRVELRGFGAFGVKKDKQELEEIPDLVILVPIPEKNIPFFKMGKSMRQRINK